MHKLSLFVFSFLMSVCAVKAQFPSSSAVYIYEYDHTYDDGIISQSSSLKNKIYFVNIQNNILGYAVDRKDEVRLKLIEAPNYYKESAINMVASDYKKSKIENNSGFEPSLMNPGVFWSSTWISYFRYSKEFSTTTHYTYREYAILEEHYTNAYGFHNSYKTWQWKANAFSFSSDKSEMFIWSIDNTGIRHYYKRISESDLSTNLDFLY